jgi:chromosome segregation ATPase
MVILAAALGTVVGVTGATTVMKLNPTEVVEEVKRALAEDRAVGERLRDRIEVTERRLDVTGERYEGIMRELTAINQRLAEIGQQVDALKIQMSEIGAATGDMGMHLQALRAKQQADESALEAQGLLKGGEPR